MRCVRRARSPLAQAEPRGLVLSGEQADTLVHVTDGRDMGVIIAMPEREKARCLAWHGMPGKRQATRCGA